MVNFPLNDQPGSNCELRPEHAPRWLNGMIEAIPSSRTHVDVRGVDSRGLQSPRSDARRAAVLMLLAGSDHGGEGLPDDATIVLTHRSPTMRSHSGQIAFPGGRVDPIDANPVDAALREAWEEVGLDRGEVTPMAELDVVHIRPSGYPVHPVLGYWHSPSAVGVASPAETDDVFSVPLQQLIDPTNRLMVGWAGWQGPAFKVNDYLVWGFTAGLLSAMLDEAGWQQPWNRNETLSLEIALANSRNNEPQVKQVRFSG
ncbi:NUDIX hydrolase [Corynebacterium alimapuense]|uniref:CoA pyrophosphatase n=1 Tax=Corynebacterium alimapuense TaxID=1576874 RepID=A0A3M8K788_9CORY|nr:CoA pyrophosphatase [Corynebacterium alimapuense]RNE49016.1 CoA pyrophosphatase [Corynebacterium alimapuense]